MYKLLQMSKSKEGIYKNRIVRKSFTIAGAVCLAYQVWCGIYFFCQLLTGRTYWF